MRLLCCLVIAAMLVVALPVLAEGEPESLGPGQGIVLPGGDDNPCPGSTLLLTADGTWENGYAWRSGGVVPPDYGSFAEGYAGTGWVCGIQFFFSTLGGYFIGQSMDCYVWDSDGMNPDHILSITPGIVPEPPGIWPEVTVHDIAVVPAVVEGDFFVGSWGNWPGMLNAWFWVTDNDGPDGLPRTKIAPGIGYPTGWQHPEVVWGPTASMGIGAYLEEGIIPSRESSWGKIKTLY